VFCAAHPDTTLFLQSNLRTGGIVDRGEPAQGSYAGAFEAGRLVGVACQSWNGNLLVEAPEALEAVVRAAIEAGGRAVAGILGPGAQVAETRRLLGLEGAATDLAAREVLLALPLAELRVPEPLAGGAVTCRCPRAEELDALADWRHDYAVEALGRSGGVALRAASRTEVALAQRLDRHFVLERDGRLVAYAAYNAETPDCVQIGGVWTPPPLRGRAYGRSVVAGALLRARERGVRRSVLFTGETNTAALAAYRALGYRRTGDWGLVLFAEPQRVGCR
jgi:ribosomal protein S18 acetylase RimI-like enzyme